MRLRESTICQKKLTGNVPDNVDKILVPRVKRAFHLTERGLAYWFGVDSIHFALVYGSTQAELVDPTVFRAYVEALSWD